MIEIRPLIQRTGREIEAKFGVGNWSEFIQLNPESRYVEIDNRSDMYELINDRKFSGEHIVMLFLITIKKLLLDTMFKVHTIHGMTI